MTSAIEPIDKRTKLQRTLWFAYFALISIWTVANYCQIFVYLKDGKLLAYKTDFGSTVVIDFVLWYNAGVLAAQAQMNKISNMYDPVLQGKGISELVKPYIPDELMYNQYPPQFYAIMRLFALVGMDKAFVLWDAIALVCLLPGLIWLSKELGKGRFTRVFFVVAVLGAYSSYHAFLVGQTALYQVAAAVPFWLFLKNKKPFCAGLISAFLLIKLQYAPFVLIIGFLLGRMRYLGGLLVSSAILGIFTYSIVGWNNIVIYPQALAFGETSKSVGGVVGQIMQNFRGQVLLFVQETHQVHVAAMVVFGLGIAIVFAIWCFLYPRLTENNPESLAFKLSASLTTLVILMTSPHTHIHDYMSIAIPAAFLFPLYKPTAKRRLRNIVLRVLFLSFPILSWVWVIGFVILVRLHIQAFLAWAIAVLVIVIMQISDMLKHGRGRVAKAS